MTQVRQDIRMWREIRLLAASMPVVFLASMSDVVASGGYYMAMAAGTIVAESLALTGSIGVAYERYSRREEYKAPFGFKEWEQERIGLLCLND
ncbi:Serine protease SPPA, chloroplastic-like protein [Drosera capensis]